MSGNVKGIKPKYEDPTTIDLGEMARGAGGPGAVIDCTAGLYAYQDCTAGTAAVRACTAGVAAHSGCTAGGKL
jgi:hypothetical protein